MKTEFPKLTNLFEHYFELSRIGIAITDENDEWLYANNRLLEMLEYTEEELYARKWKHLTEPLDYAADNEQFDATLRGEIDGYEMDQRLYRKDGSVLYAIVSNSCHRNSEGEVDFVVSQIQDITPRIEAEEERDRLMYELQERYKESSCLYSIARLLSKVKGIDDLLRRAARIIPVGWQWPVRTHCRIQYEGRDYLSERFRESEDLIVETIEIEGQAVGRVEVHVEREHEKPGEPLFLKEEKELLSAITHALIEAIDNKLADEEIARQNRIFLRILGSFPEVLYVTDPETDEVLFANRAFAEKLKENPVGKKCYKVFQGLDDKCDFCTNDIILKNPGPYRWEHYNPITDTTYHITDQLVKWQDGRDVRLEVAVDISEMKKYQEEREALSAELMEKNEELSQVVYVASHDLRSPLVNVQGFSRELKAGLRELKNDLNASLPDEKDKDRINGMIEEDLVESLDFIEASTTKMDRLLTGLLKISRLGRTELQFQVVNMKDLINSILQSMEFEIKQKSVKVELGELPEVWGDYNTLSTAIDNLVKNAIIYCKDGEKPLIRFFGKNDGDEIVYCVADNGIGIDSIYHKKVFELYHRLNPQEGKGDGMGLAIVKRVADRHKGRVWVKSEPGKGSRFFLALPAKNARERNNGNE